VKPIHPPSIDHRPQSGARLRSIRIPFANNLSVPFNTKSSASPFCAFTYHPSVFRSYAAPFLLDSVPLDLVFEASPRRALLLCPGSPHRSLFEFQDIVKVSVVSYTQRISSSTNVFRCNFTKCACINKYLIILFFKFTWKVNNFAKVSKNLAKYRSESNLVKLRKYDVERSSWLLEY